VGFSVSSRYVYGWIGEKYLAFELEKYLEFVPYSVLHVLFENVGV